jgi:branched-chain amino acid transport system substrate-binding protein
MGAQEERKVLMKTRYLTAGLLVVLIAVVALAAACGGSDETTTTAGGVATTAQTTATTAATTETSAPTETTATTAAGGPATGEPIKVGFPAGLTGSSAAPADSEIKGAQLQVDWINANGGINGRPIELIIGDDQSDVSTMAAVMTKMIEQDKVFALIGPFEQAGQEAARAISEKAQIPLVACGPATLEQIADGATKYTWSVMVSASSRYQAEGVVNLIKANGYKNVLAIADVLPINQEQAGIIAEGAAAEGFAFTKMPDTFGFDQTDFQPLLNKMMEQYKALNPDAVFLFVNPIAAPTVYKGLRDLGVTVPIVGSSSTGHPAIFAQGPQAVDGMAVVDLTGVLNPAALPDDAPNKAMLLDFAKRYQEKYDAAPDMFSTVGADYVTVLAEALKAGGDDKEKVRQALVNLSGVMTLEGPMTFTPDNTNEGDRTCTYEFQVKNAVFEFVRALQ